MLMRWTQTLLGGSQGQNKMWCTQTKIQEILLKHLFTLSVVKHQQNVVVSPSLKILKILLPTTLSNLL